MPTYFEEIDYGLSRLARCFHQDWTLEGTARRVVEINTEAEGTAAPMLDDALRLVGSPLSDAAVTALWRAATGRYQDLDLERRGLDGRQWLREIVDVCVERIRQDDPGFTVIAPAPADGTLAPAVLDEIDQAGAALEAAIARNFFRAVPGVVPELRPLVESTGPDLGFRLFLRIMYEYLVPVSRETYDRWCALGKRFGYGSYHLEDLEFLTKLNN